MNYAAKKIYVNCDEQVVRAWAAYLQANRHEVVHALRQEHVRHEMWFLGQDEKGLHVIGVMDVDDAAASSAISQKSDLSVDRVHRAFKAHWDRNRVEDLSIDRAVAPKFEHCEVLIDVQAGT